MSNDQQKMTNKSQEGMQAAAKRAEGLKNSVVEPEHLLFELIEQESGLVPRLLEEAQVKPKSIIPLLNQAFAKQPKLSQPAGQIYASNRLQKIFEAANKEALLTQDELISTEHFLLAMLKSDDSELKKIFKDSSIKLPAILEALKKIKGSKKVTSEDPENQYEDLKK